MFTLLLLRVCAAHIKLVQRVVEHGMTEALLSPG